MSKPTSRYNDKLNGLVTQTIGAMSALCMEPDERNYGRGPYLKDQDKWAGHSYKHLEACMELIGDLINERRLEFEKARLRMEE
jgi:hypothetical protein